jgi:hypothetical protein
MPTLEQLIPNIDVLLYSAVNAKVRRDMIRQTARSAEQERNVWAGSCQAGRGSLRTISPWTEFQNKDEEHALFYAFQRVGPLNIVARGPGRLRCFEPLGPEGAALLQRLCHPKNPALEPRYSASGGVSVKSWYVSRRRSFSKTEHKRQMLSSLTKPHPHSVRH